MIILISMYLFDSLILMYHVLIPYKRTTLESALNGQEL